jgi:hypothetical protein
MSKETFQEHYERLTDDELAQVLADKEDLVPEALEALGREVQRRHFVMPGAPQWSRQPGSDEQVNSLEDYDEYRKVLVRKKTFGRYWYLVAIGPFALGLLLGRTLFENSIVFIFITLSWAMCVAIYGLILNARFLGFKCPQCSQGFGRGGECFHCGFPRSGTR